MINAILTGIFTFLQNVINILLTPIDLIFTTLFPNVSKYISIFENFLQNYIPSTLAWANNLLPPITQELLGIYLTIMIGLATAVLSVHAYTFIYRLIQKIKLW